VVKDYSQIHGIDYSETFAPVTRYDSLRLIIALAAQLNLSLWQADIKTAFLNGNLKEEIWMSPPPAIGLDGKALRLNKALYGLKQAPLAWYQRLQAQLLDRDFVATAFDPCVFIHKSKQLILGVYVDDITMAGSESDISDLIRYLEQHFKISNAGPLKWLLGIEIIQSERAVMLSQEQYTKEILDRFGFLDSHPVSTPLDPNSRIRKAEPDDPIHNQTLYQQMIGCLMYLVTGTRPDLAHSVSFLSQFSAHPTQEHHTAVKRVFKYLNGTRSRKLVYPRQKKLAITGYSDASYANDLSTRRSYSGYAFFLGDCCISWMSKKQSSVSVSTTEAEYMALSLTVRQAIWYIQGCKQLRITIPVSLLCDNQSTINLTENPILSQRTKHIDVHYHFTRERYHNGDFDLGYVPTANNAADLMTKGLTRELHSRFVTQLGCKD
jgi:hypothetical protein